MLQHICILQEERKEKQLNKTTTILPPWIGKEGLDNLHDDGESFHQIHISLAPTLADTTRQYILYLIFSP